MPKKISVISEIEYLYKQQTLDALLYGWVSGLRSTYEGTSVESTLTKFYKHFDLTEDDYPLSTAMHTYFRIRKGFLESQKTKE